MGVTLTAATRSTMCDALVDLLDVGGAGSIEFVTAGLVEVATCPLNATAFGAAASGVATMNVSPAVKDTSATGGTTTLALFKNFAGTEKFRCTVGTVGTDIVLTNNVIAATETLDITSLTVTVPAS